MKTQEEIKERELHLDSIFEDGYEAGLDPYSKPASKWLMKKHWCYDKEERKAYNVGYKRGNTVLDKVCFGGLEC